MARLKAWFDRTGWSDLIIGLPYLWLVLFFLLRPDVIAKCTDFTGYANANKEATPLVDPSISGDPAVYPDDEILKRLYTPKPQTPEQEEQLTRIWTEIKTGG